MLLRVSLVAIFLMFLGMPAFASGGFSFGLILYVWYALLAMFGGGVLCLALVSKLIQKEKRGAVYITAILKTVVGVGMIGIFMPLACVVPCLLNPESVDCKNVIPGVGEQIKIVFINALAIVLPLFGLKKLKKDDRAIGDR